MWPLFLIPLRNEVSVADRINAPNEKSYSQPSSGTDRLRTIVFLQQSPGSPPISRTDLETRRELSERPPVPEGIDAFAGSIQQSVCDDKVNRWCTLGEASRRHGLKCHSFLSQNFLLDRSTKRRATVCNRGAYDISSGIQVRSLRNRNQQPHSLVCNSVRRFGAYGFSVEAGDGQCGGGTALLRGGPCPGVHQSVV